MTLRFCLAVLAVAAAANAQTGRVFFSGPGGQMVVGNANPSQKNDCAASGTVVNSVTGAPIPRAMVMIGFNQAAGAATDAQGRWSVTNTACGMFFANASRTGFIAPNQVPKKDGRQATIELVSGTPVTDWKIELMPEASIAGQVLDSSGDPVEGAQLRFLRATVQQGKRELVNVGVTSTDSAGNFRIGRLTPGHYLACADSQQVTYPEGGGAALLYRESCFPGPPEAGAAALMTVDAGREARMAFTLTPVRGVHVRGAISGLAASAPGSPGGASLQLMRAGGEGMGGHAVVSPDGTFEIGSVAPGSYVLSAVQRPNPQGAVLTAKTDLVVGGSDVNGVALALQAPGAVTGTVRYEFTDGVVPTPNLMAYVNLAPAPNAAMMAGGIPQVKWDAAHEGFEFTPMPAGPYRVEVSVNTSANLAYVKSVMYRGQELRERTFSVDGAMGPIEVVVGNAKGDVDLTVNDGEGHPGSGSVVVVGTNGQRMLLNAGEDGHVEVKTLPVGEYRAWAFESFLVPYAEEEWMNRYAGPGEKIAVTSGGSVAVALKRVVAPAE